MRSRFLTVLIAAIVVVGGLNVAAYAATGGKFLLGKSNTANRTSTLTKTGNGPALSLKTKASAPPLKVSSSKRVARLNADTVDGKHAKSLQTRPSVYELPLIASTNRFTVYVDLNPGVYQVDYSVLANMSAIGATVNCFWNSTFEGSPVTTGYGYGATFSSFSTSNSSTTILTSGTADWLECFSDGGNAVIGTSNQAGSQITVTRIDSIAYKSGSPTAPRGAPRPTRTPQQG